MTRYTDKHRYNRDGNSYNDTPIVIGNIDESDDSKTYYCKHCSRRLNKLIDSSGDNPSYYCNNCSIEVIPSFTEDIRVKPKVTVPDAEDIEPSVSYSPDPTEAYNKKRVELKGAFTEMRKKGIKIHSYEEEYPNKRRRYRYD